MQLPFSALLVAFLMLAGCQSTPTKESVPLTGVAILSSNKAQIFSDVANSLQKKLGSSTQVYYLTGEADKNQIIMRRLNETDVKRVVTIGLKASRIGNQLINKQVVFCQVFNYQQYKLVSAMHKGVSAVPPPDQLFRKWKQLAPGIKTVLSITGQSHQGMLRDAQLDARRHGVRLKHIVVKTDKEFVYTFKQNIGKHQGLWLLPDNRVLSRRAIHEVMSYSVKNGVQVMVFTPQLLPIGGLISASADSGDVANQVYRRLQDGAGQLEIPGPAVTPLTRANFKVNDVVAHQLGLISKPGRKEQKTDGAS